MLEKIFQLNEIGKELGLSKKEINRVFLFDDKRYSIFYKILLVIISIIIFSIVGYFIVLFIESTISNTYPAGTLYSTVKIKDYKTKKWKFKIQIRRDYLENEKRSNSTV